jgi:hypothetical protein
MSNQSQAITERQRDLLKELRQLGREIGLSDENIRKIRKEILSLTIQNSDALKREADQLYGIQELEEEITAQKQRQTDLSKLLETRAKNARKINEDIEGINERITKLADTMFSNTTDTYDVQKKLLKEKKAELLEQRQSGNLSLKAYKNLLGQLNAQEQTLEQVQQIQEQYKDQFESLSALGGLLGKNFGIIGKAVDGGINKGMSAFTKSLIAGNDKSVAMKDAMKAFGGEISATMTKALGVVGIITLLYDIIKSTTDQAKEFATATGVTVAQAQQLVVESRNVTQNNKLQLATSKDILAVQQETVSTFGTMATLTTEQAGNIAELGRSFGYGAQQAAQVNNAFMSMGASAGDAYEAQQSLAAEALKAGVNVGAVTKDISENAKVTSKYFGGNVTALKNAAIEAAKMGMNLQTMTKVADQLLNIESSLTAQFEFQALSGRQIDLDMARQLALTGDIAGASKEVLAAVGSAAEFNQLSVLEKKKLAEATGMEVDELQKSLVIQEKLGDLTDDQKAAMSGLNLSAAELRDMDKEDLQAKLAQQQSLDKTNKALEAAKDQISNALLPVAQAFADVLASIAPMLEFIGDLVWFVTWPFVKLVELAKTFGEYLSSLLPKWDELGIAAKVIVGIVKALAMGAVLWGAWAGLGWIPVVGPALAIGAAAAGLSLVNSIIPTGDLAMGANNGPIVANPREGTIFQGTSNDEVAMGPGVIGAAQGGAGTTVVQQSGGTDPALITGLMAKVDQLIAAVNKPTPAVINWGDRDTTQVANAVAADRTTRATYNGR